MLDRTKLVLAGMSIALSVQLSPPVSAAVPVGKVVQTPQTNSSEAAKKLYEEAEKLYYQEGTKEALTSAIAKAEEALKLYRSAGDRLQEAIILNNIGFVYTNLGEQQKALQYFNQSLPVSRAIGDRRWEATALNNIGIVYSNLGEQQKALDYYNQSLPLSRAVGDRSGEATTLNQIGGSLANYQIVHFATHGMANSKNPELSGIVMSTVDDKGNLVNGFLRLTDIFNLKLAANLVVLSACQSGMGQNVKGEGMVGLTRGFMYAGAQRVAVSLWSVDDEGTAVLMQKFYQKMLQQKLAPAAALRAAQMEMMQQEKWKSPYYWAAFTLQGEWK